MEGIWNHVPVHWQQDKFQSWANYLMYWMAAPNRGSQFVIGAPTALSSVLTTWPCPIHKKKQIGTSCAVSHTWHNTESILDSPLGCLFLALAHRCFFVWGTRVSVFWWHGKFQLCAKCCRCWMPASNRRPQSLKGSSATNCCVGRANHSVIRHPSETEYISADVKADFNDFLYEQMISYFTVHHSIACSDTNRLAPKQPAWSIAMSLTTRQQQTTTLIDRYCCWSFPSVSLCLTEAKCCERFLWSTMSAFTIALCTRFKMEIAAIVIAFTTMEIQCD